VTQQNFPSLPDEYQQVLYLAQQQNSIEVIPLEEIKGGRTGAKLFLVSISRNDASFVDHLILKLDHIHKKIKLNECKKHKLVSNLAPKAFAESHIPGIALKAVHGDCIAIFYTIAGQSLLNYEPLASFQRQDQLKKIFATANSVLLDEWNTEPSCEQGVNPGSLLERWLGYRLSPGGKLDSFLEDKLGIPRADDGFILKDKVFPNPLFYCRAPEVWGSMRKMDALIGFSHRDLNISNILVNFKDDGLDLEGFYLIDFALFQEDAGLFYDQHYLEMSYLVREVVRARFDAWIDFIAQYADEDMPDSQKVPIDLAGTCAVFNRGRLDFKRWLQAQPSSLADDLWGQYWLAGVAAGLNYCNKTMLGDRERFGALIYAASHLKRFCNQFNLPSPQTIRRVFDPSEFQKKIPEDVALIAYGDQIDELAQPAITSPIIGRHEELQAIRQMLEVRRLVTVTGPGGIGKTRLSRASLEAAGELFRDGAYFVPLLSLTSATAIIPAIANVVGFSFKEGRKPSDQLLDHLGQKNLLLVLDNLEHLLWEPQRQETLNLIEKILIKCPLVRILITSRELLRIPDEHPLYLDGLDYSGKGGLPAGSEESALMLFLARAEEAQVNIAADDEIGLNKVREICRLVDGLPLGIELAAAQLRLFTLDEIHSELGRSLDVLDTGLSGSGARHGSLNSVFEASYQSLSAREQVMFARLSIFQGGFSPQAAYQVAQIDLRMLGRIMDKSLVQRLGTGRFDLHPLIHMFAAEKPKGDIDLNELHYQYYRDLLKQVTREWRLNLSQTVFDQLRYDSDNLIAGWNWVLSQENWDETAAYLDDLWQFFKMQGRLPEVMELLEQAYREGQAADPPAKNVHLAYWRRRIGQAYLWMSQLQHGEDNFREVISLVDFPLPASQIGYLVRITLQMLVQLLHRVLRGWVITRAGKNRDRYLEAFIAYEQMAERAIVENKNLLFIFCVIRSLNLSEITGDRNFMARAYATTGFAFGLSGVQKLAELYLQKANQIIRQEASVKSRELVLRFSGYYYALNGEYALAEKSLLQAANLAGELGQNWIRETNWTALLFVSLFRGEFVRALYFVQRIKSSAIKRGDAGFEAAANYWGAAVKVEQNKLDEAIGLIDLAAAAPKEVMNILDWVIVHTVLAQVYLRQGRTFAALDEAEHSARIFNQIERPSNGLFLLGYSGLADVYLRAWEHQKGGLPAEQLQNSARLTCRNLIKFAGIFPSGQPRAFLYQGLWHWLEGDQKKAQHAWQKSLLLGEKYKSKFDQGLTNYEIGKHLSPGEISLHDWTGTQHLQRAEQIFEDLGAVYYLEQVNLALAERD